MSMVYVWNYPHEDVAEARGRLDELLGDQAATLSSSFGRTFRHTVKRVGHVLVGQVDHVHANGVRGWRSWIDHGSHGVAWSGVCEDYLGRDLDEDATRALHETAVRDPARVGNLTGSFLLVSWDEDEERVCITTGDTMCPPLWLVSGVNGWACGSRSAPLFGLVGAQAQFDHDSATLFLTSSYHVSGGTFFRGTTRIGTRQQLLVRRGAAPNPTEYISESAYLLGDAAETLDVGTAARACAEALVARTARQLRFSTNPVLELTGGEDSRCIGAAIVRGGGTVPAYTGGGPGSLEVRIAQALADAFGFEHTVDTLEQDRLSVLLAHRDLAKRWLRLSEGLETIRQGLHWERYFLGALPVFSEDRQFFNGLQTGFPHAVPATRSKLLSRVSETLTHHASATELLADGIAAADDVTIAIFGEHHHESAWAKVFYWQRRCSIWGYNVMSVKSPIAWYWLPLVDATLVRSSLQLLREGTLPPRFMPLITRENAPHVASIKYLAEHARKGVLARAAAKVWRLTGGRVLRPGPARSGSTFDPQYFVVSSRRPEMWRAFFDQNTYAWKDLIDQRHVYDLIASNPQSQLLWNLATVELVAQEFF